MKYNIFSTLTPVLGRFFTDPEFPGTDPDIWPMRTQKKILIQIQEKKKPDPKHWFHASNVKFVKKIAESWIFFIVPISFL